jgi:hypothetical protein
MEIKNIRYDATAGVFQARVDVERDGKTFRYPVTVPGPITLDEDIVRTIVVHQARRLSAPIPLYSHT